MSIWGRNVGLLFFVLVLGEVDGVQLETRQRSRGRGIGSRGRRLSVLFFGRVENLLRTRYRDMFRGQGLSCGHYDWPSGST